MEFSWVYTGEKPIKLRSALKQQGVTSSLIKAAIFHGGQMTINHEVKWAVDLVEPGTVLPLSYRQKYLMIMFRSVPNHLISFMKIGIFW